MAAKKVQKSLVTIHATISGSFKDFQETIPEQVNPPSHPMAESVQDSGVMWIMAASVQDSGAARVVRRALPNSVLRVSLAVPCKCMESGWRGGWDQRAGWWRGSWPR